MSIVPVSNSQGLSLAALGGVDQTPFDPATAAALGALLNLSLSSDAQLVATAQRTATEFEPFIRQLKEQAADLQTRNQQLREQIAQKRIQNSRLERHYIERIELLNKQASQLEEELKVTRQKMQESATKADERIAAAIAEQAIAVKAVTKLTEEKIAAINLDCEKTLSDIKQGCKRVSAGNLPHFKNGYDFVYERYKKAISQLKTSVLWYESTLDKESRAFDCELYEKIACHKMMTELQGITARRQKQLQEHFQRIKSSCQDTERYL